MNEQLDRIEAMVAKLVPADENQVGTAWVQQHVVAMLSYMATGKKIEAIKECRTLAQIGLKDAKDLIYDVMK